MIKLQAEKMIVHDAGAGRLLDLEELRADLDDCCRQAGLKEPDLADDLVGIVRRYGSERLRRGATVTLVEVEALVVRILLDSGLRSVATLFQQQRQLPAADSSGEFAAIATLDLADLLSRDPFFLARPSAEVLELLPTMLERLHLRRVSPAFVQTLARHLYVNRQTPQEPVAANGYWLVGRSAVETLVAEHAPAELVAAGLAFLPVSALFPRLIAEVNLHRHALACVGEPLTELAVLPAFDRLCQQLLHLLRRLARMVTEQLHEPQPRPVPAVVRCRGLAALAGQGLGLDSKGRADLRDELAACLNHHFLAEFACQIVFL